MFNTKSAFGAERKSAKYEAPQTALFRVRTEGMFCASEKIKGSIKVKAEVDDYITLDNSEITFE